MKKLTYAVPMSGNELYRGLSLKMTITSMLVSCARTDVDVVCVDDEEQTDDVMLEIVTSGKKITDAPVVVDLSAKPVIPDVHNLTTHRTYTDCSVAGWSVKREMRTKVETMLDDDSLGYVVLLPNGTKASDFGIDVTDDRKILHENTIALNPWRIERASHCLMVSPDGVTPLVTEPLVGRHCLPFYLGLGGHALRPDVNVVCNSFDDFLNKASAISCANKSCEMHMANVYPHVFSVDVSTGRETRIWLAGLLEREFSDDFGLFDLVRGDEAMMNKVLKETRND